MQPGEGLRVSDPAVVARYLHIRRHFHDRILARVETDILACYRVQPTSRIPPTIAAVIRTGFMRPGEGEVWPTVFLTAVDISLALYLQMAPERVDQLGTTVNGPQRIRRRQWEGWWGWEVSLGEVHPHFYELSGTDQDDAMVAWYRTHVEWLATNGLLQRQ